MPVVIFRRGWRPWFHATLPAVPTSGTRMGLTPRWAGNRFPPAALAILSYYSSSAAAGKTFRGVGLKTSRAPRKPPGAAGTLFGNTVPMTKMGAAAPHYRAHRLCINDKGVFCLGNPHPRSEEHT